MKKKVVVGMSGGVDSSVAAFLLKEQGYDVIGVTMQIWQDTDIFEQSCNGGCCGLSAVDDARRVAELLEIPYYVMNFRDDFQREVIDYFITEYEKGHTPNPCIACNRYVKWESLLHRSLAIGADYIATGHYARIQKLDNGRYTVRNSVTATKDQTYALYNLTQYQLARTLMPVGEYEKPEIRRIAAQIGLPVAAKQDSQDICFVPDHDYAGFIQRETGQESHPGQFVDTQGNILGKHRGIIHYTIGQRKGLGISSSAPLFVQKIRPNTNEVVLCSGEELFTKTCYVENVNYMSTAEPDVKVQQEGIDDKKTEPQKRTDCVKAEEQEQIGRLNKSDEFSNYMEEGIPAIGKIRYSHKGAKCRIYPMAGGRLRCEFQEPQRAITPGQAAVFYEDDHILCGGTFI